MIASPNAESSTRVATVLCANPPPSRPVLSVHSSLPHSRSPLVSPLSIRCPPFCQICSSYVRMNVSWFVRVLARLTIVIFALSSFHGILRSSPFPLILCHVLRFTRSLRCGTLRPLSLTSFAGFLSCVYIDLSLFVRPPPCCVRFALQPHVHNA